jgi:hypothetical protein
VASELVIKFLAVTLNLVPNISQFRLKYLGALQPSHGVTARYPIIDIGGETQGVIGCKAATNHKDAATE